MSDDDGKDDDFEARWPAEGDRLFLESDWAVDAQVTRNPAERFYRMPIGYKRAGDILIDHIAINVVDRPNVIYAALFCYRQSLELFLKRIVDRFGGDRVYSPKNTHDLGRLWERFMCLVNERGRADSDGLSTVEKLITEMNDADQKSDGFRFAMDVKGAPFGFGDRGIDLAAIRTAMQGLQNFFESCYLDFAAQDDA